jgi:hypothetical protein
MALRREIRLPSSEIGSVLLRALRRLASVYLKEVMGSYLAMSKWARITFSSVANSG